MSGSSNGLTQQDVNSPEFVRKLVDKVYALWLRDLQIERERRRPFGSKQNGSMKR